MNALSRGLKAVFVERRVPYRVQLRLDRMLFALGYKTKLVRSGKFQLRVRRRQGDPTQNTDEAFIQNVIVNREYIRPGYDIHPGETVIDIGGNIGTFAVLAASEGATVYSYEPSSENFALLRENVRLNGGAIHAFHEAVAGHDGTVRLNKSYDGGFHSTVRQFAGEFEEVKATTLKVILERAGTCHLMKMDCEGAEYDILYALPREYWSQIQRIVMEWHGVEDPIQRKADIDRMLEHMKSLGYRIDAFETFPAPFRGGHLWATLSDAAADLPDLSRATTTHVRGADFGEHSDQDVLSREW